MNLKPAHRQFVSRAISWDRVQQRLVEFPAIAKDFALDAMRSRQSQPPYYCHQMAWRLSTFGPGLLSRINQLFDVAHRIPGWSSQRSLIQDPNFGTFWSLLWQLQVAEFLTTLKGNVSWGGAGPDLLIRRRNETVYVECYCYRKSFGLELFVEELLGQVDPNIRVFHQLFLPFSLPKDRKVDQFLDQFFTPFLAHAFLDDKRAEAEVAYPVILAMPAGAVNFVVYLEGLDADKYQPGLLPQGGGDRDNYLALILREAISSKQSSNKLCIHRPNLLAVNYLLSADMQVAVCLDATADVALGENIDGLTYGAVGIDRLLSLQHLTLRASANHPASEWWR